MIKIFVSEKNDEEIIRFSLSHYVISKLENEEIKIIDDEKKADICITDDSLEDFLWEIEGKRHILVKNSDTYSWIDCFLVEDNYIWLLVATQNGYVLNKMSINENTSESYLLPGKVKKINQSFSDIVHFNNKIYLMPNYDDMICILMLDTGEWKELRIPNSENIKRLFSTTFIYDNKIYIMPRNYPGIVILDYQTDNMQVVKIDMGCNSAASYCIKGWLFEKKYVFYSNSYKAIFLLDIKTLKIVKLIEINENRNFIVEKRDNKIYLLGGDKVWIYDLISKDVNTEEYVDETDNNVSYDNFSDCVFMGKTLYLFPGEGQEIAQIDIETKELKRCEELINPFWKDHKNSWKCEHAVRSGNSFYVHDMVENKVIKYDGDSIRKIQASISKEGVIGQKIINAIMNKNSENELLRRE